MSLEEQSGFYGNHKTDGVAGQAFISSIKVLVLVPWIWFPNTSSCSFIDNSCQENFIKQLLCRKS